MLVSATRLELPTQLKLSVHLRLWLSRRSHRHPFRMPALLFSGCGESTGQGSSSLTTQPPLAPFPSPSCRLSVAWCIHAPPSMPLDIYTFGFSDRSLLHDRQGRHCSPSQGCPWEVAKEGLIMQSDNQPCSLKLLRPRARKGLSNSGVPGSLSGETEPS